MYPVSKEDEICLLTLNPNHEWCYTFHKVIDAQRYLSNWFDILDHSRGVVLFTKMIEADGLIICGVLISDYKKLSWKI